MVLRIEGREIPQVVAVGINLREGTRRETLFHLHFRGEIRGDPHDFESNTIRREMKGDGWRATHGLEWVQATTDGGRNLVDGREHRPRSILHRRKDSSDRSHPTSPPVTSPSYTPISRDSSRAFSTLLSQRFLLPRPNSHTRVKLVQHRTPPRTTIHDASSISPSRE